MWTKRLTASAHRTHSEASIGTQNAYAYAGTFVAAQKGVGCVGKGCAVAVRGTLRSGRVGKNEERERGRRRSGSEEEGGGISQYCE